MADKKKPIITKYSDTEWEFIYPPTIDNEKVYNEYWEGVEHLGYNDISAEKIFISLIKRFPFYIDAYNHLSIAFKNQKKHFESFVTVEKVYNMGKSFFPKEFDFQKDKLIWAILDNRPFLRSCQIFGLECQEQKDYKKAIEVYNEILQINKNDNQGIRYLVLECLFALKDYEGTEDFLNKFEDDWSIEFSYGKLVVEILKNNIDEAKNLLNKALEINPYLPNEIIKDKHIPPPPHKIPKEPHFKAGIPIGSIQQAFDHWKRNKTLYRQKIVINFFKLNNTSA